MVGEVKESTILLIISVTLRPVSDEMVEAGRSIRTRLGDEFYDVQPCFGNAIHAIESVP